MVKTNNKQSLKVNLITLLSLLAIVLFITTPILFLNYGSTYGAGIHPIWGWTAITGGTVIIKNDGTTFRTMTFDFNWQAYLSLVVLFTTAILVKILNNKSKTLYVISAILFAGCAVVFFTMKSTWLLKTWHFVGDGTLEKESISVLGVGPWVAGLVSVANAILSIVLFRTVKNK